MCGFSTGGVGDLLGRLTNWPIVSLMLIVDAGPLSGTWSVNQSATRPPDCAG